MAISPDISEYAFVSIGANLDSSLGTPADTIAFAMDKLAELSDAPLLTSSIYLTSPVDSPKGTPDFHNAMVGLIPRHNETPHSLLRKLQGIENSAGRIRSGIINEARTLDLDLVLFGKQTCDDEELQLPHPRALARKFVLVPLCELASEDFVFPGTDETLADSLLKIQDQELKPA